MWLQPSPVSPGPVPPGPVPRLPAGKTRTARGGVRSGRAQLHGVWPRRLLLVGRRQAYGLGSPGQARAAAARWSMGGERLPVLPAARPRRCRKPPQPEPRGPEPRGPELQSERGRDRARCGPPAAQCSPATYARRQSDWGARSAVVGTDRTIGCESADARSGFRGTFTARYARSVGTYTKRVKISLTLTS